MEHLAILIRRSFLKVYFFLVLFCTILVAILHYYNVHTQMQYTAQVGYQSLLRTKYEALSLYGDYLAKRKLPVNLHPEFTLWLEKQNRLEPIISIPGSFGALRLQGTEFYKALKPESGSNTKAVAVNPTNLSTLYTDFIGNVEVMALQLSNYAYKPSIGEVRSGAYGGKKRVIHYWESMNSFFIIFIFLLLALVVYWAGVSIRRKIRGISNDILDLLWVGLKQSEPPQEDLYSNPTPLSSEYIKNNIYVLSEECRTLSMRLQDLRSSGNEFKAEIPKTADKDQLAYIQKLLARLFTRAERAAALAKASAGNGVQAGILALNVSIEAARAGEAGRPFLAISDKIKDFGEKTSRIGEAIAEEIKDADSAIRKAYTTGKALMDASDPDIVSMNHTRPLRGIEDLFESVQRIQDMVLSVESAVHDFVASAEIQNFNPKEKPLNEDEISSHEAVLHSFELLYSLTRGDVPPTHILKD